MSDFPDYLDVDYADGEGEDPADYPALEDKIEKAGPDDLDGLLYFIFQGGVVRRVFALAVSVVDIDMVGKVAHRV